MCGICGILNHAPERPVSEPLLGKMNQVLFHRGPDEGGVWTGRNVGLAHRRLSIIDLSPLGKQPMSNEDGTVWITFNGEIYNYLELRSELLGKGHQFRSKTDTEVLVHLWEEEGPKCVERLCGMFAFAIWDDRAGSLFLARDRMGKKPLFYADLPDRFLFGSEIKAILQDLGFVASPDLEAIHYYLTYQSVPSPCSAFKGVKKLPPAHSMLVRDGKTTLRRYWKLSYRGKREVNGASGEMDLREEIVDRLREAVGARLMSDVPLGAFLSGGIDSSMVVAMMAGLMDQPVKTFSIGFDQEEYNEVAYARMVAGRYETEHHEFFVKPDAVAIFPKLVWHYNEPFADSSAIPTYYVCELARKFVTVCLSGDGGDENFAGYPRYTNQGSYALGANPAGIIRRWLERKRYLADFYHPGQGLWKNARRLGKLDEQHLLYYYRITHFHEGYQKHLYTQDMKSLAARAPAIDVMLDKYRDSDAAGFLDSTLYTDFSLYLPDTLMTKVDIASMAHSLEVRAPLLDHRFIEFAAAIPPDFKLKDGVDGKYIFKKAAEPHLPHDVIYRKKMGFGAPIEHWFRNELKEMTYDTLLSSKAIGRGYFQRQYIEQLLDRHQKGETWQYLIWSLLFLELWHLMFIDGVLEQPS